MRHTFAENKTLYFTVAKINNTWYTEAWNKVTGAKSTMAGFTTKKIAVQCAKTWATWME